jgi:glucose dehydrogenase
VTSLRQVCSCALPEAATFESGLAAVNGILYFTTAEYTYAIDANSCGLKWRVRHELEPTDRAVRGVVFYGNRVFRGFPDGTGIAYNAGNGEQLWSVKLTESDGKPATISASPIAWNGIIFIGTFGAEWACGCIVAALDAASGRVIWTFNLVPTGNAPGAERWPKGVHVGGGSVWTSLTLDPAVGALYVPTGNPGPDFSGGYRPGANLYTGSIVVLDAKTGSLRTWYQLVPHDVHDWDQAAAPALITTKQGRRRAMAAGKDGYLHAIDLASCKVAWKTAVTTIDNVEAPLTVEGTHFCPGATGGVLWNGPAYSAITNLVYVNSLDWCSTLKMDPKLPTFEEGKQFLGSANNFGVQINGRRVGLPQSMPTLARFAGKVRVRRSDDFRDCRHRQRFDDDDRFGRQIPGLRCVHRQAASSNCNCSGGRRRGDHVPNGSETADSFGSGLRGSHSRDPR